MGSLKERRVLVTGASGFIGSRLVARLVTSHAKVFALCRYVSTFKNPRLSEVYDQIEVVEGDLRNPSALRQGIRRVEPEIVFHLAAYTHVGRSFTQLEECLNTNVVGTGNLLQALRDADLECFVYTSTSEVYGPSETPFKEDMKPHPVSPYSASKYAGEVLVQTYYDAFKFPATIVRPFNAYGPFQSCNRIIPEVIVSSLLGKNFKATEGKQTREFIYVEDLVEGLVRASLTKRAIGEIINLGSGIDYTIREIVEKILFIMGNRIQALFGALPYRPTEIWRMVASTAKAERILGWKPRCTIDEGLRKTINWYEQVLKTDPKSIYILSREES